MDTNAQEHHIFLLHEFRAVCQKNHLRINLPKWEFMREEIEYLAFDVGYGWWKPAASEMQPLQDMHIHDDPKNRLDDVRIFIGARNSTSVIFTILRIDQPPVRPYKKNQPLAGNPQAGGCFPGVEEENLVYQLPGGTLARGRDNTHHRCL